jgi:hypothetical protein
MIEYSKNKTKRPKKIQVPTAHVAYCVGCSTELVNKIRSGVRKATGVKGQQVELADALLQQEQSKLLQKVKELVQL